MVPAMGVFLCPAFRLLGHAPRSLLAFGYPPSLKPCDAIRRAPYRRETAFQRVTFGRLATDHAARGAGHTSTP